MVNKEVQKQCVLEIQIENSIVQRSIAMKNRLETQEKSCLARLCFKMRGMFMKIKQSLFKKKVFEYTDLAPIDNIENGDEYIKALKWALKQQRVKNIAIAGPYGSGKSSIIESFLKLENAKKYLRVSMATFIENAIDSQEPGTDNHISIPTAKIEEGILKQLFYKVNYKRIPQSRYRKLHKIKTFGIGLWMVIAIAIACVLLFVFWPEKFATAVNKVFVAGEKLRFSKNWTIALFGSFAVGCIGLFSYVFRFLLSKIKIKETKIPGVETTIEAKDEKTSSVFDKHLDEIVYFFEETKYKVVFFEDLDRLEDPSIFVRLRELNTILNNYDVIKHRIVFVYAVKDDIFTEEDRTKFFDFIIPVIPVINSTNSGEILLHLLEQSKKKGLEHRISQNFIDDVSPYIADMRILLNSYNEFIVYKNTLQTQQGLELSDEMMMAIIIFKNLYPSDFADIQKESGLIKQAFVDKQCAGF